MGGYFTQSVEGQFGNWPFSGDGQTAKSVDALGQHGQGRVIIATGSDDLIIEAGLQIAFPAEGPFAGKRFIYADEQPHGNQGIYTHDRTHTLCEIRLYAPM